MGVLTSLAGTLLQDIVPDLLACVPGQPTEAELAADPNRYRFVMVVDREGATQSLLGLRQGDQGVAAPAGVKETWRSAPAR